MTNPLEPFLRSTRIAYFSMELTLRPEMHTYSGGLGVLGGDTARSAADLELPMVFVLLVSRAGYVRQQFDARGLQNLDNPWRPEDWAQPLHAMVAVQIEGREVWIRAGWAATLVAIHCEGPVGTIVLNGSPLSYWAGESGANPMRLSGGLLGGSWLTNFVADLGDGRFDGAWLIQNFETLKPEGAIWEKYANLYLDIDREEERFLDFERWWNAWYSFSREEIVEIVDHLFIGNELEQGTLNLGDEVKIDLRNLRSPLVIFSSYGDNITPPHQALAWLKAVYKTTADLKEAGQRIVYVINPHVGHLGIFVSASVARFEHRAILESLDDVEALAPGLYEMKISNPTGDPDCRKPQYSVAFEERRVEDLIFDTPREAFERVRQVSQFNEALYRTFVSPWVQAAANPWSAAILRRLHPMRTSRYLLSEKFLPWMHVVAAMAKQVREHRVTVLDGNPLRAAEKAFSGDMTKAIETVRQVRDKAEEQTFRQLYG